MSELGAHIYRRRSKGNKYSLEVWSGNPETVKYWCNKIVMRLLPLASKLIIGEEMEMDIRIFARNRRQ